MSAEADPYAGKRVLIVTHRNAPAYMVAGRVAGEFLKAGAHVTIVAPEDPKLGDDAAEEDIRKQVNAAEEHAHALTVSFDSVTNKCDTIIEEYENAAPSKKAPLHYMIHVPLYFWASGDEMDFEVDITFARNFLFHVLLTERFLPHLVRGNGRVVSLFAPHYLHSSMGDEIHHAISKSDPADALGSSNLNLLAYMTYKQQQHAEHGVHFVPVCAGLISQLPAIAGEDMPGVDLGSAVDLVRHACEVKLSGNAEHNCILRGTERFEAIPKGDEVTNHIIESGEKVFTDARTRLHLSSDALAGMDDDDDDGFLSGLFSCCGGDRK